MHQLQLTPSKLIRSFNFLNNYLIAKITDFLQEDDLSLLIEATQNQANYKRLFKIAKSKFLFKKYINAGDRAYYFSLYEHPRFTEYESQHIASLTFEEESFLKYQMFPLHVEQVIELSIRGLPCTLGEQLKQQMMRFATDPGILMPGLKRETLGLYANSSFQNFLVLQKDQNSKQFIFLDEIFQNLKQHLIENDQKFMISIKDALDYKVKTILYRPHLITYQNLKQFLIQNNPLHNLIACLFALLDLRVSIVKDYVDTLKEPFHQMIQLMTRYSLYESMITTILQNMGFIFQQYSQICGELLNENIELNFWRPALAKWISKMQQYHQKNNTIFHCLVSEHVKAELKEGSFEEMVMEIPDPPLLLDYKHEIFSIVQSDPCDLQILLNNFQEYFIDISINEDEVHWCGHTKQNLDQPFQNFQSAFLLNEQNYLLSLKPLLSKKPQAKKFLSDRLDIQSKLLKPRVMTKLIDWVNIYILTCSPCEPACLQRFEHMNANLQRANKNSFGMLLQGKINDQLCISKLTKSLDETNQTILLESEQIYEITGIHG